MTNITLLTQFFPPETNAGANRVEIIANEFSKSFQISVYTPYPSYPNSIFFRDIDIVQFDSQFSFPIKRVCHLDPHSGSLLLRGIRELYVSIAIFISALPQNANIILISSPSMFLGPIGYLLAKIKHARLVWDIRDLTWRYYQEKDGDSILKKQVGRTLERFMSMLINKADLISCATPGITKILRDTYLRKDEIHTIPNGVTQNFLKSLDEINKVPRSKPIISYIGVIGINQGIDTLVQVASKMPELDFLIVGDGPERKKCEALSQFLNCNNVKFTGYLHKQEIIHLYNESTILFSQLKDTPTLNETGNPSKLLEYMAAKKPIIYAGKGLAAEFLESSGAAVVVPSQDTDAIINAIRLLLSDPPRMKTMGIQGREFVQKNYVREEIIHKYLRLLETYCLDQM